MSEAAFHGHACFTAVPEGVTLRHDWSVAEVRALHELPLFELIHRAHAIHRVAFKDNAVQLCSLLSVKTPWWSESMLGIL